MSKFKDSINNTLSKMREVGGTDKGSYGEEVIFKLCEQIYQSKGGILYHSFTYKTDANLAGNIKRNDNGTFYIENTSGKTEIDVLLITPNRIYPIEVKAYKSQKIILTDKEISGCYVTNKSPIHQNEMHCRHLYPAILPAIPNGLTAYICPIVVFVDKCAVYDERSEEQKNYIRATVAEQFTSLVKSLDTPLDYLIDLRLMDKYLNQVKVSSEKYLPCREVK